MNIEGVKLTPLKIIEGHLGAVMHAVKKNDVGLKSFGEAYFSTVGQGYIKAWKRHQKMTLNLVVPTGEITFVLFDDRPGYTTCGQFFSIHLSRNNYQRSTVPPFVWMGFQGVSEDLNILLNIASIPHDPEEADQCDFQEIKYSW